MGVLTAAAVAALVAAPGRAAAQGATNVIHLTADTTSPSQARVGAYYTQVLLKADGFAMPSDDKGKKNLGAAILTAFGLGDKTRSLTISAVLTQGGKSLPEVPLITYSFNGKKTLTNYEIINSYLSPRWQLGATDAVSVALNYKFSDQATYSPTTITDNLKQLIPADAIVSTLGTPFVQGVANLTASVFSIAGSRTVNVRAQDDLLPYGGGVGARALTYDLALPNGTKLGKITASLMVSPSLIRPADRTAVTGPNDLKRQAGEDVATLALDVAGAKKNLLQEVEGLSTYAALTKAAAPGAVKDHCAKASQTLNAYGVTAMDRTTLVYRSLQDAGFDPSKYHATANSWRTDCFGDIDRATLTTAINLDFTPAPEPAKAIAAADRWTKATKGALGCWATSKSGEWCDKNAPNARASLDKAFADKVQIGLLELPGVDLASLPAGRQWDKYKLIDALSAKADQFSCFEVGLILVKDNVSYVVGVEVKDDLISAVQIQKATDDMARCLRS